MKSFFKNLTVSVALMTMTAVFSSTAKAGCGEELYKKSSFSVDRSDAGAGHFAPAAYTTHSMVGMWDVKFMAGNQQIDFGYSVWHSDGTEFLNSGGRAPVTQNYCLGVWVQTGPYTYRLNHLALSYDTSGKLDSRVRIHEDVTLANDGMSFIGRFAIDVFDPTTGTSHLAHVGGTITGKRVTVFTTTAVTL